MLFLHRTLFTAFVALFALDTSASDTLEDFPLEPEALGDEYDVGSNTVFITPARMASSVLDSPNAVTRLDVSTLQKLGITDLVDAMRLVPGMVVSETFGSDVSIGYHGANVNVPRRSEVLYNSNRLHRPGYAVAHWYRLPIDLEDLNFIEVVRGASPEYGTNAMTSTINLVQDTIATRGLYGSARVGDGDTREAFINGGWLLGNTQVGVRYFHRSNDGFDGATDFVGDYTDDVSTDSVMLNIEHRLANDWILDVAASYVDTSYQVPGFAHLTPDDPFVSVALGNFRVSPDAKETAGFISTKLHGSLTGENTSHEIVAGLNYSRYARDQKISLCGNNFSFDPRVAEVDALPSVRLSLGDELAVATALITGNLVLDDSLLRTPTPEEQSTIDALGPYLQTFGLEMLEQRCGVTDQDLDEDRYEFNSYVVSNFSESLQNVLGVSLTHNNIEAQTYLGGNVGQDSVHIYNTVRYSPATRWVLNSTVSFESADNVDSSDALSYRAAANYQLGSGWVIRFMHSRSERLPDVYETDRNWTYFTQYDPGETDHLGRTAGSLTRLAVSPDNLRPEVLRNTELGLSYNVNNRLSVDAKVFYEDYNDLISEAFNYVDFRLTNDGELENTGFELGIRHTTASGFEWGASYMYLDADSDTPFERSLRSDHSGSVWAILPLGARTHLSGVYYGASNVDQESYNRFDFTVGHRIPMQRGHVDLQVNYRRYPDAISSFTEVSSFSPNESNYDGQNRIFFTAALSFF